MKKSLRVLFSLVALSMLLLAQTQTKKLEVKGAKSATASATYTFFPYTATEEGLHPDQRSGCICGIGNGGGAVTKEMLFSPTAVTTGVNQPVQIRYDATQICRKQGISDLNGNKSSTELGNLTLGYVQWEVGAVSPLPLEWGIITYDSGYAQPTQQKITINLKVRCTDTPHNKKDGVEVCGGSGYNVCTASATIPVTVK
jgi:hypothetical protein